MKALSLRTLSIRPVLLADAAITGATGLLMLLGASPLADLLDLPTGLLAGAGAVLIPYVAILAWLARREAPPREAILGVIVLNLAWAAGCVALLLGDAVDPNALGTAFILIQAVAVLVFADLQAMALRGGRARQARNALTLEV